ncbi:MAG: PilZ domain-containing protein [Alphaproteobacteria bacterium]
MRRRLLLAIAIVGLALVPSAVERSRMPVDADGEWPSAAILALAPAAGPEHEVASVASSSNRFTWLGRSVRRSLDARFLAGFGAVCGLLALAVVARRQGVAAPVAAGLPARIAVGVARAPEPAPRPARVEVNALSNALATIDMLDLEMRTSLKHAGQSVAELTTLVAQGQLVAVEPGLMMAAALEAARTQREALAACAAEVGALRDAHAASAVATSGLVQASRLVLDQAEAMDRAFQSLVEVVGGEASVSDPAARVERFQAALAALTEAIVAIEERLVTLDEAVAVADCTAEVAPAGGDAGPDAERAATRLADVLGSLGRALGPADNYVAEVRRRAEATTRTLDQALARVATILSGFEVREERRRFHRIHAEIPAKVLIDDRWTACRVVNLSLGGAAIDVALDAQPGTQGQFALKGWDGLVPLIVTGNSPGRTHVCFQLTEALEQGLRAYLDRVPEAA